MDSIASNPPASRPAPRLRKTMPGALRWVIVALIAFGLGALLIGAALYIPARQTLNQTSADLELATVKLAGQTEQITSLQTDNATLQKSQDSTTQRLWLARALASVNDARLAVAADDYAGARLSLTQASEALDTFATLPGTKQSDVVTAMQQNAAQALTALKSNLKSTQPELDQLAKNLKQLGADLSLDP